MWVGTQHIPNTKDFLKKTFEANTVFKFGNKGRWQNEWRILFTQYMVQVKPPVKHVLKSWLWYNCFPVPISKYSSKTRTDKRKSSRKIHVKQLEEPECFFNICLCFQLDNDFASLRVNAWSECTNQWGKFSSFSPSWLEGKPETIFSNDMAKKNLFLCKKSQLSRQTIYINTPPYKHIIIKKSFSIF